jgi:molybdopterin converting factor small subunit
MAKDTFELPSAIDEAGQRFTRVLQDFGFDHLFTVKNQDNSMTPDREVEYSLNFTIPYLPEYSTFEEQVQGFIEHLHEGLEKSKVVKQLTKELSDEIEELNLRKEELENKIAELEKYKTHHDLEMQLRHGYEELKK